MKSLIKFPLLALFLFFGLEATTGMQAFAGQVPVVLPGSGTSGVGDTFSPDEQGAGGGSSSPIVAARISSGVVNTIRTIESQLSVPSIGGRSLSILPEQVAVIVAAATATGPEIEPAIAALEQQLELELGGLEIDISALGSSAGDLETAISTTNEVILSLNSEQLAAAIESPTFMALLRMLGAANQAAIDGEAEGQDDEALAAQEGGGSLGILQLSLLN